MALDTPRNWWQPLHRDEKIWLYLILAWALVMLIMMPLGHLISRQNVSSETYKTSPKEFREVADRFVKAYQQKDADGKPVTLSGLPVVEPPPGSDVFLVAEAWRFWPVMVFKKGETYRVHMSSMDFQHGFSLQPQNLNFQILPDYDYVITMTPRETGEFHLVCNEYCFYAGSSNGHDTMVGKLIVK